MPNVKYVVIAKDDEGPEDADRFYEYADGLERKNLIGLQRIRARAKAEDMCRSKDKRAKCAEAELFKRDMPERYTVVIAEVADISPDQKELRKELEKKEGIKYAFFDIREI